MCRLHHIIKLMKIFLLFDFYGITQDPETKNYIMVLNYAEFGSLRNYLNINYDKSNWDTMLFDLYRIAVGLEKIHEKELLHRDLHVGNILRFSKRGTNITDMGLCKPADFNKLENTNNNNIYGVLS